MSHNTLRLFQCLVLPLLLAACSDSVKTQSVEDFYRGKTLEIIVGFAPGGGYDTAARGVAPYLEKYLPGHPKIIVRNMPGAGSVMAANTLVTTAAKDGSVIGIFSDTVPFTPIWNASRVHLDPRTAPFIVAVGKRSVASILVRSAAPATTLEGARNTEVTLGATGPDSSTSALGRMANELLGTKFKIVLGYAGTSEIYLAMERGEVDGRAGSSWTVMKRIKPNWFRGKPFVAPVVAMSMRRDPDRPDIPVALDYARNAQDRQVMELVFGTQAYTRMFIAPPGVPEDRLAALRAAFRAIVQDKDFIAYGKDHFIEPVDPSFPNDIMAFVNKAYSYPQAVRDRAAKYVGSDD